MTIAEQVGLFSKLSPEARARILAHTVQREYGPDEYVFFEGDGPAQLWFLERGRVKLLKHSDTGKDVIVTVISAGGFIGGAASPDKAVYPVTAQAIEPSSLRVFPENAYIEMLRLYPDVSILIIHGLEQRLNEAYDTIRSMAVERVERRIARLLLKLAGSLGKPVGGERILIDMPLSRQEIAEMTGTTVESAIRVMSKFRKQGLVESKNGKVFLVNPHALVRIADEL
jgi:CRP-like cAMP-binding protein